MPNWTSMDLAQLRQASKTNIITNIGNWLNARTKAQIIELLMDATEFADKPEVTTGEHGRISHTQTVRDALGAVIRIEGMRYDYFDTGEVHDIVLSVRNAKGRKTKQRRIRHFRDRRQPVMTVEAIEEPLPKP